jgi:hypothetical protein
MKRKLLLGFVVLLLAASSVLAQQSNLDSALFGTWVQAKEGDEYTFNQDGTFSWKYTSTNDYGKWSVSRSTLTLIFDDGETWSFSYTFRNGALYIENEGPYQKR